MNSLRKKFLILIVIIISTFILDLGFSNKYLTEILSSVEKTEAIMEDFSASVRLRETGRPGCFGSENVGRVYCGSDIDNWVRDKVYPNAKKSRIDLEVETFKLNQIRTGFLGNEFEGALQTYTKHANAWLDYLKGIEKCLDYSCYYAEVYKPNDISTTFRVAEAGFSSVIPLIDFFDSERRIKDIFKN